MRTYRAIVHAISSTGKPFRHTLLCQGGTADHAALDALKRIWRLLPGLQAARVGGVRWQKDTNA